MGFSELARNLNWLQAQKNCTHSSGSLCPELSSRRSSKTSEAQKVRGRRLRRCETQKLDYEALMDKCHEAGVLAYWSKKATSFLTTLDPSVPLNGRRPLELRDGLCREDRFGSLGGINATCSTPTARFNTTYRWKTFQHDVFDFADQLRVFDAARRGPTIVVLEGAGPHHFVKFREHYQTRFSAPVAPGVPQKQAVLFTAFDDFFDFPQHWIDDYVAQTKALLRLYSSPPQNVCVVWKMLSIGPRSNLTRTHHPSVLNGPHHWLNRMTKPIVEEHGIKVLDMTDLTLSMVPAPKLDGFHATPSSPEGDPYHGFRYNELTPPMMERICKLCETRRTGNGRFRGGMGKDVKNIRRKHRDSRQIAGVGGKCPGECGPS
eukprot:Transcript_17393.p1 GENE.Transcript_17393~~Transcript_17393.p1  ORF type:complete len:439 (+),score=27.32 Transcript_17393:193-1317(+)